MTDKTNLSDKEPDYTQKPGEEGVLTQKPHADEPKTKYPGEGKMYFGPKGISSIKAEIHTGSLFFIGPINDIDRYATCLTYSSKQDTFKVPTNEDPYVDMEYLVMGFQCEICGNLEKRYLSVAKLREHRRRRHGVYVGE